jgi:hypothetical protein
MAEHLSTITTVPQGFGLTSRLCALRQHGLIAFRPRIIVSVFTFGVCERRRRTAVFV